MVAIIIDDLGNNLREVDEAIGLGVPLCVAVMPHQRYSTETARRARAAGLCVLLHMPMQPKDNAAGLGVGALMSGMDAGSVRRTLFSDLSSVPGCIGVNNHMGSLVTAEAGIMQPLMTALKTRNMFFVDSMTAPDSRAGGSANAIGVAHCNRDVFLDNTLTDIEIEAQVERLIRIARRKGSAVAICHPHPETFAVLKKLLPKLKSEGITIVNITEMVK